MYSLLLDVLQDDLCRLVENRIGLEKYQDCITSITKHDLYSRSLNCPQPNWRCNSDLLLDHEFCKLLRTLEGMKKVFS